MRLTLNARWLLALAWTLTGCAQAACQYASDCAPGENCINGECVGPPCTTDSDCVGEQRCLGGYCRVGDAGAPDAGRGDSGVFDAGAVDSGAVDSGAVDSGSVDSGAVDSGSDAGISSGVDAGPDSGPACECSPGATSALDCGRCGVQTRTCTSSCTWGSYGACLDTDSRCTGVASMCRGDYCWGWEFANSAPTSCVNLDHDYLPADPSALGVLNFTVYGRPGASWVKQNRHTSCGGAFADAESGTLNAGGRSTHAPFTYGASDCTNGTLGRFDSRVHITDSGGAGSFYLPTYPTSYYNSTCTSDRSTCSAVATYCSL